MESKLNGLELERLSIDIDAETLERKAFEGETREERVKASKKLIDLCIEKYSLPCLDLLEKFIQSEDEEIKKYATDGLSKAIDKLINAIKYIDKETRREVLKKIRYYAKCDYLDAEVRWKCKIFYKWTK
jgi:hemerythrin-like domain-containing protein